MQQFANIPPRTMRVLVPGLGPSLLAQYARGLAELREGLFINFPRVAARIGRAVSIRQRLRRDSYKEATADKRPIVVQLQATLAVGAQAELFDRIAYGVFQFGESIKKCRDEHISGNSAERIEMNAKAPAIILFGHSSSLGYSGLLKTIAERLDDVVRAAELDSRRIQTLKDKLRVVCFSSG